MNDIVLFIAVIMIMYVISWCSFYIANLSLDSHLKSFRSPFQIPKYINDQEQIEVKLSFLPFELIVFSITSIVLILSNLQDWSLNVILFRVVILVPIVFLFYKKYFLELRKKNIAKIILRVRADLLDDIQYKDDLDYFSSLTILCNRDHQIFLTYAQAHQYEVLWYRFAQYHRNIDVAAKISSGQILESDFHYYFQSKQHGVFIKRMLETQEYMTVVRGASEGVSSNVLDFYNKELDLS